MLVLGATNYKVKVDMCVIESMFYLYSILVQICSYSTFNREELKCFCEPVEWIASQVDYAIMFVYVFLTRIFSLQCYIHKLNDHMYISWHCLFKYDEYSRLQDDPILKVFT